MRPLGCRSDLNVVGAVVTKEVVLLELPHKRHGDGEGDQSANPAEDHSDEPNDGERQEELAAR